MRNYYFFKLCVSLFIGSILIITTQAYPQSTPDEKEKEKFSIVEQQPSPKNGMAGFYKYVSKSIKYPTDARRNGIEGKVFVQFVVDKNGVILPESVSVIKGVYPSIDEEAKRIVLNSPPWNPGIQDGEPVDVRMVLPITFKLGKSKKQKRRFFN